MRTTDQHRPGRRRHLPLLVAVVLGATCLVSGPPAAAAHHLPSTTSTVFAPSWSVFRFPDRAARPAAPPLPAGAEGRLVIDDIGLDDPIFLGGQSTIDQDVVTHFDGRGGWRAPVDAGAPGTYWLAAHRTKDGRGPFARVPELAVGARVRIVTAAQTFTYVIENRTVTGPNTTDAVVYGRDRNAVRLLLQTCLPGNERLLLSGTLAAS